MLSKATEKAVNAALKALPDTEYQIQADRSGTIWINVRAGDPRLSKQGVISRIKPKYNHTHFANEHGIHTRDKDGVYTF